jgi:segregation and condensation protein B
VSEAELQLSRLEALIFSSSEPLAVAAIRRVLPGLTPARIEEGVARINEELAQAGRPYEIAAVAGGYQFRTRPEFGEFLAAAQPERRVRLSKAALETLAVIAYRQPVTRPEVEEVRSVDCGPVIRSLMERDLVRIVGRRDAPGRPPLYGTSAVFLETFGLRSLRDMPSLRDVAAMEEQGGTPLAQAQGGAPEPDAAAGPGDAEGTDGPEDPEQRAATA